MVCTDEPGLQVYDQSLQQWLAIEEIIHAFVRREEEHDDHRRFGVVFWGDSVSHLSDVVKPCLHRVKTKRARSSIVFKQRTMPIATSCRYGEDYILVERLLLLLLILNFFFF